MRTSKRCSVRFMSAVLLEMWSL